MDAQQKIFIANTWAAPSGTRRIEVISPTTEEVIGSVPVAEPEDIDRAVAAARQAFDSGPWPRMSVAERAEALFRVVDAFEPRAEEAIRVQIDEMGAVRQFLEIPTLSTRFWLDTEVKAAAEIAFTEVRQGLIGDVVIV